ncbi:MAG: hypothetical protein KGD65_03280 [Candidatus Lokiarchaeota archaeon]|nr:hypothetical protein [Candidatus Lokiarchaeota archaeon]
MARAKEYKPKVRNAPPHLFGRPHLVGFFSIPFSNADLCAARREKKKNKKHKDMKKNR